MGRVDNKEKGEKVKRGERKKKKKEREKRKKLEVVVKKPTDEVRLTIKEGAKRKS